jgi:hypothetical protein
MKKLILILAIAFVAFAARGQTAVITIQDGNTFAVKNTNYTLTNTTVSWFKFVAKKDNMSTQDFECNLDSLSGNHTNVAVSLYGRKFSTDDWTQIGSTVNWTGTTSDTTLTISNTEYNRYREYKANFLGTGTGTTTIDFQKFKQWLQ